jgi:hypothetical protein
MIKPYPTKKIHLHNTRKIYVRSMSTLLTKMKTAVDRANEICFFDNDFCDDECLIAWNEIENVVSQYTLLSKMIKESNKIDVTMSHDVWDVVH